VVVGDPARHLPHAAGVRELLHRPRGGADRLPAPARAIAIALLEVEHLSVEYRHGGRRDRAVDAASFAIESGQFFGLVGESGCGKSTVAKTLLRLLPATARVTDGAVRLNGTDLLRLSERDMRRVRWRDVAYIPQSALNALDPVVRVGEQVGDVFRLHGAAREDEIAERTRALFEMVGLDPLRVRDFPHQFSGGMRQRVTIAMAFALQPALVIADEPTTALDVLVQDQILAQIRELRPRLGHAMLLITHDISLVAENCEAVAVMYAGRVVERGPTTTLFTQPAHPYTLGLQNAFPDLRGPKRELIAIPGAPPAADAATTACPFAPRCPFAEPRCTSHAPPWTDVAPGHGVACHFPERAAEFRIISARSETWRRKAVAP
jgi:oligopeptide/dipeptide ABC transporter ATP-binding protein